MNKVIGGYFELELRHGNHYHKNAIRLNTARNCFEYILLARKYKKIYIPYYTCEVMLQPLRKHHIEYEFYSINFDFEPVEIKQLQKDEAFLYTNYFGLKQNCVKKLSCIYKSQLIVDNSQAFFAPRIEGIDTFYSPRKFVGVPDGAYLYTDCLLEHIFSEDKSYDRIEHLLLRIEEGAEAGYSSFRVNDRSLDNMSIMGMSKLTQKLLRNIDYDKVKETRLKNFTTLHDKLQKQNFLKFELSVDDVPMVYPFYCEISQMRKYLIKNRIFVATYWSNVLEWCSPASKEYLLCKCIIPLPLDQRYDMYDMEYIVQLINVEYGG